MIICLTTTDQGLIDYLRRRGPTPFTVNVSTTDPVISADTLVIESIGERNMSLVIEGRSLSDSVLGLWEDHLSKEKFLWICEASRVLGAVTNDR